MNKVKEKLAVIKYGLRSMRLYMFLIIVLVGALSIVTVALSVRHQFLSKTYTVQLSEVKDYVNKLATKIVNNAYLTNSTNVPDISKELSIAASLYEGRIIVIDERLNIVSDTYELEAGKSLISGEAINAIRGNDSEYIDSESQIAELTIPIKDTYDKESGGESLGAIIIRISTAEIYTVLKAVDARIILVTTVFGAFLILFAYFIAKRMTYPFKQITQSLHHVSEGYIEDKVDIHGYSEMNRISDSFNEMLSRMAMLEESRQEFVSNVSHELKTPITSIKVLADSLLTQSEAPIEMYREFMQDINDEIDRENKIITDLLALVKLDRKTGDMHIAEVSINELLEIILKRIKPIAQKRNIDLVYESFRTVLAEVDEVKMSLAISNLIENAVKYNKDSGWVRVSLNSDHKFFYIKVADSGIGIPEEAQSKIFDRFYRVDKTRARETGGTGLGLSITRSVVLMHNGAIKVYSEEGEGTTFTLRIPLSYIPVS